MTPPPPALIQQLTTEHIYNLRLSVGQEDAQGSAGSLAAAAPQVTVKVLAWATGSLGPQLTGRIHVFLAGPGHQVLARGSSQELEVTHSHPPHGLLKHGRLLHSH